MSDDNTMDTLATLLQHAEAERDSALAARSRALEAERSASAQAEALLAYRADYERRWVAQFASAGTAPALLAHYQSFAARLTHAIGQQQALLASLRTQRERVEALLGERELKVASTAKLIERRRAGEARGASIVERRLDDEIGARAARAWAIERQEERR